MTRLASIRAGGARRGGWQVAAVITVGTLASAALGAVPASAHVSAYRQINLVSDQAGRAHLTDHNLVNAWGLAAVPGTNAKPGSPLWVADNGSDKATLYTGAGPKSVKNAGLVVGVTGNAPTGQVFNPFSTAFKVRDKKGHVGSSVFIFDTENGTIDGWSPMVNAQGSNPSTVTEVAHSRGARAVYKGLAIATAGGQPMLYATNFHSGHIEVYNGHFRRVALPSRRFTDPSLPAGYGPFGIAEIHGKLVVTFAKQDAMRHDDKAGRGHGFVDVFTNSGVFVHRLASRGALNSPWGLALAPAGFGKFSGDLLVGNFGNGHINAYSPATGVHLGQLRRPSGRPIVIDGLWGLMFGNGNAAQTNELIFSAGPNGEAHGLLGKIVAG